MQSVSAIQILVSEITSVACDTLIVEPTQSNYAIDMIMQLNWWSHSCQTVKWMVFNTWGPLSGHHLPLSFTDNHTAITWQENTSLENYQHVSDTECWLWYHDDRFQTVGQEVPPVMSSHQNAEQTHRRSPGPIWQSFFIRTTLIPLQPQTEAGNLWRNAQHVLWIRLPQSRWVGENARCPHPERTDIW